MQIKNNIWKHHTAKETLFIKKYDHRGIFEKVKLIHDQLEAIDFPYTIPLKKSEDPYLLVQSWQNNSYSADFSRVSHRKKAVEILKSLHETRNVIDWSSFDIIPKHKLLKKWNSRLERFLLHEKELVRYLRHGYYDIVLYAERFLKNLSKVDNPKKPTLLHGDVVHHNFLVTRNGIKLIDFDLAVVGDAADEMILWMHRALPMMDYNLKKLLVENPYLKEVCIPKLHYLQYPNELLREWQYVLHLGDHDREAFLEYLMPFTEKALKHWPGLMNEIESIQGRYE